MRYSSVFALLFLSSTAASGQAPTADSIQLTVPPAIDAVAGVPTSLWFDNVILARDSTQYRFEMTCDIGLADARR